jgi:hypothetical protein
VTVKSMRDLSSTTTQLRMVGRNELKYTVVEPAGGTADEFGSAPNIDGLAPDWDHP